MRDFQRKVSHFLCLPLHLLRDFLQVINEVLLVLVDLAALLGDDAGVDIEGLLEGDGDEVLVGKHGLAGEEGRADAALDEVLDRVEVRREVDDAGACSCVRRRGRGPCGR